MKLDLHSMQLNVKIEDERGQFKYLLVTTKKDSTLAASLENVLPGLPSYVITGPTPQITWQTPAYHLKGTQLSVKKGEVTDESHRSVYGRFQISSPQEHVAEGVTSNQGCGFYLGSPSTFTSQTAPLPFNIPVVEEASTSNNLCSVTTPKVRSNGCYDHSDTYETYNNLSQRESSRPLPCQNLPSSSNLDLDSLSFDSPSGPSHVDRQTLLKKPSYSVVETYPTLGSLPSRTSPKGYLFDPDRIRSASFEHDDDDDDTTLMKRCEPQRRSEPKPKKHSPKVSDYVPHTHPVLRFSNQSMQSRQENPSSMASSWPRLKPLPCVKNEIYVSHDKILPSSSLPQMPVPNVKPMPCVLQQRKDGYIDVVAQDKGDLRGMQGANSLPVLRQTSEPCTNPSRRDSKEEKERPKSVPDEFKRPPAQCVVSKDSHGYATFASLSSLMDVDVDSRSRSSSGASAFTVIETDADGYLTYKGNTESMTSNAEGAMEGECFESSMESDDDRHQTVPLVIQQNSNGYFGFSASPSVSSQGLPEVQPSGYMAMSRSESMPAAMPSQMNSEGIVYARFGDEDEEEDASYFDMKQMTPFVPKTQPANRHWSANDMEYLDCMTPTSQYTYIDAISQTQPRPLPPKPSPPIPMKRLRTFHDRPIVRDSCDLETVPGWCPQETEESISTTMRHYQHEDGNFIVWWIGRKRQYVITVSHLNALRNYLVFERQHGIKVRLYIFPGGRDFDNLKELVEHYMKEGLKGPDVNPNERSRGKRWQQFSHVKLRKPLRVKYSHTVRKKAS
ncbi:uncharacterized protein [Haliotis asinina]|uniref:uncharacterized protein isoform X2 n=1 Tax=Haliotis asinina TaxID=109174 RepID=UPI0035327824